MKKRPKEWVGLGSRVRLHLYGGLLPREVLEWPYTVGGEGEPTPGPPPPQTKVTIVGKNETTSKKGCEMKRRCRGRLRSIHQAMVSKV